MAIRLEQLTTFEVLKIFNNSTKKQGLLLPIGCLEQHGPYLPLDCDMAIARKASEHLASVLQSNDVYSALVLPDFFYTPSPGAESTAGTVSVSFDFLGKGLDEIITAAIRTPWDFIAIINGHAYNHGRVIEASIGGANGRFGRNLPIIVINIYDFIHIADESGLNCGRHAGEFEIALYHYYIKEYVFPDVELGVEVLKERPERIFGLNIMERSHSGIISDSLPNIGRALEQSENIGRSMDEAIMDALVRNLNIYYKYWN